VAKLQPEQRTIHISNCKATVMSYNNLTTHNTCVHWPTAAVQIQYKSKLTKVNRDQNGAFSLH